MPALTLPPVPGPAALDFSRRLSRGRMVADEKEQGFQGFGHSGKPFRYPSVCLCVGGTSILWLVPRREPNKKKNTISSFRRSKKYNGLLQRGTMPEGTNSR